MQLSKTEKYNRNSTVTVYTAPYPEASVKKSTGTFKMGM
jgi:hypothetical protein